MRDKNEVNLRGRLGQEPPRYTAANGTVQSRASFSMCTNETYIKKDGTEVEKPTWHDVVVWGKTADNAAKYLVAGQQVEVAGKIQNREYQDSEGKNRRVKEIVAQNIEYGAKPKTATVTASAGETPIATKRQQTVVRKRIEGDQLELETDGTDPF